MMRRHRLNLERRETDCNAEPTLPLTELPRVLYTLSKRRQNNPALERVLRIQDGDVRGANFRTAEECALLALSHAITRVLIVSMKKAMPNTIRRIVSCLGSRNQMHASDVERLAIILSIVGIRHTER